MTLIAQVIINKTSKQTDKKFDYLIPEHLEQIVTVGTRVCVPFGRGDKREEAYVLKISEKSAVKELKTIVSAEERSVFDEKTTDLIEWMREKYLCTYIDVIKAIVPTGTSVKNVEFVAIDNENERCTAKEQRIFDAVKNHGGSMEVNSLVQIFEEENIQASLKKMCDRGIFKKEYKDRKGIKDKTVKLAALCISPEEARVQIDILNKSRAIAQAKVLDVLISVDIISVSDLMMISQCGYSTVVALKKRGIIEFKEVEVSREHKKASEIKPSFAPVLTEEQQKAANEIREKITDNNFSQILLHGVTGSGKTEVFMNAITAVTDMGRQAVMLVPEISLTPQMMERFISRFGERVAVFHSGLSLGERYDEWKKMRDKKADIVIGARSAIFAPFDNIGIIIIDEEHEASYKSEMLPRYDTKEVARYRAMQNNSVLVYASATPDVRTYKKARDNKINLIEMKKRVNKNPIPNVEIVDMRKELADGNKSVLSRKLYEEIEKNLKNKEQTILFLNRRGFSTFVSCRNCGFVAYCPHCNISLTYHRFNDLLKCHYCGYVIKNYDECPKCKSKYIRYFGGGTQKIEEEINKLFPTASTIRMDVDTTKKQNSHEKLLSEFRENKTDILIGTQMVAKGLDFPDVTLVGVISADTMLNIDDYRSSERTFDLLEQVSGRAGRAGKTGRAVIQTYSPENQTILFAAEHDYNAFYESEIAYRNVMRYPPFCEMVSVLFTGAYENTVAQCARYFAKEISVIRSQYKDVQILGPIPAAISKINNKYRWRILIKCSDSDVLTDKLSQAAKQCSKNKNFEKISIVIDKNPNNTY